MNKLIGLVGTDSTTGATFLIMDVNGIEVTGLLIMDAQKQEEEHRLGFWRITQTGDLQTLDELARGIETLAYSEGGLRYVPLLEYARRLPLLIKENVK